MPRKTVAAIQHFRGTTAQHNTYTGPAGELTVDTTKKTVVVQDGSTKGGNPVALEKRKIVSSASFLKVNSAASGTLAQDNTLNWDMEGFLDSLATYVGVLPDFAMPGVVVAFSGQFGGEGNRYPIPEDTGVPDTNWVLCDGVTTDGVEVPDLRDKFIIGAGPSHAAGTTGGSFTTDGHTLTVDELAAHSHKMSGSIIKYAGGTASVYSPDGNGYTITSDTVLSAGGSQPHSHTYKPPYYALAFIKQIHRRQSMVVMPPVNYARESLFSSNKTSITIPQYTQVRIGSKAYTNMQPVTLQLNSVATGAARKGKDVYLYACTPTVGIEPVFVLSLNSTVPTGYTAENSRKIGGFHCLCADVGTNTYTWCNTYGLMAGDILRDSVWDLRHRARSKNEGMLYDSATGLWADIYLGSWGGDIDPQNDEILSRYGGVFITGVTAYPMVGEEFVDRYYVYGKRLPTRDEFVILANGSPVNVNIAGNINPGTAGGHVATDGQRIVSSTGLEDCCGIVWQWTSTLFEGGAYGTVADGQRWLNGYSWDMGINSVGSIGSVYGFLRRAFVGGNWGDGSHCGRRTVACCDASASIRAYIGGRGVSEPRVWEG